MLYVSKWFTCLQTVIHLSTSHLIVTHQDWNPQSCDRKSNALIITVPSLLTIIVLIDHINCDIMDDVYSVHSV